MRNYLLILLSLMLLLSCSDTVTGGSDNPDFLAGVVQDSAGNPIHNADVLVVPEGYTPSVDEPSLIKRATTNTSGAFTVETRKGARYTIELYNQDSSLSRIVKEVPSDADTTISIVPATFLTLQLPLSTNLDNTMLLFQGTSLALSPVNIQKKDSTQELTVGPLPVGEYGSVHTLGGVTDTLLESVTLTEKDTTILIIDDKGIVKELWHFPLLIGVQEATVSRYGGLLNISAKIIEQIKQVETSFSDERIDGQYRFTIDTIYTFSGTLAEENVALADSVGFRILYDAVNKSTVGNWNRANRTILHDHTEGNSDSLFSEGSLRQLMFEFGLARGCYYRSGMEVFAENNPINGEKFEPSPTIMQQRSSTLWSEHSIELINYYGNDYSVIPDTARTSCADTLDLIIKDAQNNPVGLTVVEFYGVTPHSLTVEEKPYIAIPTDETGLARVVLPLYKGIGGAQRYGNFLIAIKGADKTVYHWLPFDEAGADYLQTGKTRYVKNVLFE